MCENPEERHAILLDFDLHNKSYFVKAILSIIETQKEEPCAICQFPKSKRQKMPRESYYTITAVSIGEIREIKTELPIEMDSEKGLGVIRHINEILITPDKGLTICSLCLSLLHIVLDKNEQTSTPRQTVEQKTISLS